MSADTKRMLEYLECQIAEALQDMRNAQIKYDMAVSLRSSFETIIADQEKIDARKVNANE